MKVLAADLGGTKALLGVAEVGERTPQFLFTQHLVCAGHTSCERLLAHFCAAAGDALQGVEAACLALAGPISADGRQARFTNLPWCADAASLERTIGAPVRLVNDFSAVAAGVMATDNLLCLQPGEADAAGVRLAIGAGTGLGVAAMVGRGDDLRILASEGGHVGFAAATPLQDDFAVWLRRTHERATAERAISGNGLVNLYRFMAAAGAADQPNPLDASDIAAAIGARALADADSLARRVVDEFFACYGAFAGDMAMTFMARGGVFLAGGVTQKLASLLPGSRFLEQFNAKAEHAALVRRLPVHVVGDPDVGLVGAACLALQGDL